jgi:hypothetical protein
LSAALATNLLLKLWLYKAIAVYALQPRDPAKRINFCNWFLQPFHDGEVEVKVYRTNPHTEKQIKEIT